jgi:hypothetical protein
MAISPPTSNLSRNARFVAENWVDICELTVSPDIVATTPVTNLQSSSRGKVMRTSNLEEQIISGTSETPATLNCCVIYNTTLSGSTTIRLQLYRNEDWTNLQYDSDVIQPFDIVPLGELEFGVTPLGSNVFDGWSSPFVQIWFDDVYARSFTLTITNDGNPNGYWDASRLVMGPAIIPEHNIESFKRGWKENIKQTRTGGGSLRTDITPEGTFRSMTFDLGRLEAEDTNTFLEMQRYLGARKDFYVSVFPEQGGVNERNHAMMAKIVANTDMQYMDALVTGNLNLQIEET